MAENPSGDRLVAAGEVGCSKDGSTLFFELIDSTGKRHGFFADQTVALHLFQSLHAAMGLASSRTASRPGHGPGNDGPRYTIGAFATGVAISPNIEAQVALMLRSDLGLPLHMLMSQAQAGAVATGLTEAIERARVAVPPLSS